MKVAIVHYWLVGMRGGEKVVEALLDLYPDADIYTHVVDRAALSPALRAREIRTTFIQRLPGARKHYQKYVALMPMALEELDLSGYDLVISSESGPAKGVITGPYALHVCYCHSPMRYLWDQYHLYRASAGQLTRAMMSVLFPFLRVWDVASAARVDAFVANSNFVARRIRKVWGRSAAVIFPPVDVERFTISPQVEDFYLCAGQLVPYKRVDIAIEACNRLGRRLVIVGGGQDEKRLRAMAGPTVEFLGRQDDEAFARLYSRCRALLFPGEEDFGIVPIEAMASGRPVIAFDSGGVRDTVVDGFTGVLFARQTADAMADAIQRFERAEAAFDPEAIRAHAQRFDASCFKDAFRQFVADQWGERSNRHDVPHGRRPLLKAGL